MTTARAFDTRPVPEEAPTRPPVPETVEDTGLTPEFITDLLLKTLYV